MLGALPARKATQNALIMQSDWREKTSLSVDNILSLLELCLNSTYFMFRGHFYRQRHGCAMGSPVSPIVADLFMEDFEEYALDFINFAPRTWLRYVDDTFCVIKKDHVTPFREHLNSINPSIKFTRDAVRAVLPVLGARPALERHRRILHLRHAPRGLPQPRPGLGV